MTRYEGKGVLMRSVLSPTQFFRLACIVAVPALVLANGPTVVQPSVHAAPAAAHQPVTLSFAVEFTDAPTTAAANQYLIKPFEQKYPWITVKLVQQNGASGLDKYLKTSLTASAGPDVFDENGPAYMPPFADAHQLLPLNKYAKQYGWASKVVPYAYKTGFYKGQLIDMPSESETLVLWYNKTLFDKNGWKPPTTFDQLVTLGKAIQAKGLIPFGYGTSDCKPCWEWWQSYALNAELGPQNLYKVLTGKMSWTDPLVVQAFTKLKELWDLGFISNKQASALSVNDGWGLFGSQKAVMKMEGTWGFSPGLIFNYAKGFNWSIAPLPSWRTGVPAWPAIGIGEVEAINAATKHPAEAALFLNWFYQSPSFAGQWAYTLASSWVPPLKYTAQDFPADTNPLFRQVLLSDASAMQTSKAGYLSWSAWPAKTEAYMWSNCESVLYGTLSIPNFLQQMETIFKGEQAAGDLPTLSAPPGA
jgi:raffinose/stachyose/melibiose transport system substrate-binding protein